ncbi:hypothetical protein ADZ37_07560 [Pannonibacter phragmitetus]|uniref:Uncharacterized protein n=1 Tax=Pannonibacter phragmitetus TaxID=121719 RepID=A0A0L0J1P2_9HYPH|nr:MULTISPECIES: hypothetical protein [Pannonibacter]ALV27089.1 hypothetical protein APZ00_08430 [Pannonibacter phragmitetus]KND19571.1 hypothetical protein ADZ37_07560 [Pannonibacter phragmitetus]
MKEPVTSAKLRDEIDHGQTADKVSFPDPAAAPLGTDDEAAGNPPTAEQVAMARKQELKEGPARRHELDGRPRRGRIKLLLVAAIILAAVAGYYLSR